MSNWRELYIKSLCEAYNREAKSDFSWGAHEIFKSLYYACKAYSFEHGEMYRIVYSVDDTLYMENINPLRDIIDINDNLSDGKSVIRYFIVGDKEVIIPIPESHDENQEAEMLG